MLTNAVETLRASKYSVIGVDDIHLVDHLSATLLHQLAVEGAVRIVATARSGVPIPETVTAMWKDGYLTRLDISPFTRSEVVALIEAALGGRLEGLSADLIWQASGGNPLFVRHLIDGALEAGNLKQVNGVWQLRGRFYVTAKLAALLDSRLDNLDSPEMRALQLLAVDHPLALDLMGELADSGTLERLEQSGLITVADRDGTARVDFTHALIGEAIRLRTGQVAGRRLKSELLTALADYPAVTPAERVRRAELCLESDAAVDTGLLLRAAADAISLMNIETAERLAQAAQDLGAGFPASELLARSMLLQGRNFEAETILGGFDPESLTEFEFARWGITRVANLRWSIGDGESAEQLMEMLHRRIAHPAIRLIVDGLRSALLVIDGDLERAAVLADQVLTESTAPAVAVGWAVFGGVMAAALSGRTADAGRLAAHGREISPKVDALLGFLLALGEVRALTLAGEFDIAQSRSGDIVRITSPNQFRARAMAQILAATVEVGRGQLRTAMGRLEENLAALSGEAGAGWIFPARLLLVQCYCGLGLCDQAAPLVGELREHVTRGGRSFEASVRLAEAWLAAAEGHVRGGISAALDAAVLAAEGGQRAIELMALHAAARFGDESCLPTLWDVASAVGGPLAAADATYAAGLMEADAAVVFSASVEFERVGALLSAADSAAQASALFDAAGDRRHALEAAAAADRLARQCGGLRTPALLARSQPLPLSAREREIAHLVARGLSNREIADRLFVSRRTVEGHLYRIFAKLDLADRDDLTAMIRGNA